MSAHTPGPWKVVSESTARELDLFEIADVSHLRVICDGNTNGYDVAGSPEADARLIAAAPELLEELENCSDLLSAFFCDAPVDSCIGVAIIKARAAIAKATGAKP